MPSLVNWPQGSQRWAQLQYQSCRCPLLACSRYCLKLWSSLAYSAELELWQCHKFDLAFQCWTPLVQSGCSLAEPLATERQLWLLETRMLWR